MNGFTREVPVGYQNVGAVGNVPLTVHVDAGPAAELSHLLEQYETAVHTYAAVSRQLLDLERLHAEEIIEEAHAFAEANGGGSGALGAHVARAVMLREVARIVDHAAGYVGERIAVRRNPDTAAQIDEVGVRLMDVYKRRMAFGDGIDTIMRHYNP